MHRKYHECIVHLMQDLLEKDESLELSEANPKAEGDQYSSKVFCSYLLLG